MKLMCPSVPDWFVEVTDKEAIERHLAAGWQEVPKKRVNAKKTRETEQNTLNSEMEVM